MCCLFLIIRVTSSLICWVTRLGLAVWEEECLEAVITTELATVLHIILTSIPIIITILRRGTSVTSPSLTTTCSTLLNMNRNGVSSRFLPPSLSRMLRVTQAQVIVFVLWFSASSPIRARSKYEYERGGENVPPSVCGALLNNSHKFLFLPWLLVLDCYLSPT